MIVDFTKIQSEKAKPTQDHNLSSHPEIQEYHHTLFAEVEGEETISYPFLEMTIRNEGFKATAYSQDDLIHFQELVETPSTRQGSTENSEVLSFSCETQTLANATATPNGKNLFRVVLVNEQGERVIDTLVAPQVSDVACKGGQK
jgi:hypothetical protein